MFKSIMSARPPEQLQGLALLKVHEQFIRGVNIATEGLMDIKESSRTGRPLREHLGRPPLQSVQVSISNR